MSYRRIGDVFVTLLMAAAMMSVAGCPDDESEVAGSGGTDAGTTGDAGIDTGTAPGDAGIDTGTAPGDAGTDTGTGGETGTGDAEVDTGTGDTGTGTWTQQGSVSWSDVSVGKMNWANATAYCEGISGRLPTISELRELVKECPVSEPNGGCAVTDACLSQATCWTNESCIGCNSDLSGKYSVFGDTAYFWSSSEVSDPQFDPDSVWVVSYSSANISATGKKDKTTFRCVK